MKLDMDMELDQALELLKNIVKENGTNDQKHLDLGLVSVDERPLYEKALRVAKLAVHKGKITQDEFCHRIQLN